jgi:predicted RNA-binding Zn-ribbon protein involved in translation (DUF1610 family)
MSVCWENNEMSFVCDDCGDVFKDSPYRNSWCPKCGAAHILCEPCRFVHEKYAQVIDELEAQL